MYQKFNIIEKGLLRNKKIGRPATEPTYYIYGITTLRPSVAKDAQQEQEEVDKIEVERKGTHTRELLTHLASLAVLQIYLLKFVGIKGRETH